MTSLARTTRTQYDSANRPVTVTANYVDGIFNPDEPDRDLIQVMLYGPAGERQAVEELRGGPGLGAPVWITTTYGYDNLNRLLTTTTPLTGTAVAITTVTYDALGRVTDSTDPLALKTHSDYDALGRPVTVTANYVDGSFDGDKPYEDLLTIYAYDAAGDRLSVKDPKGIATQFQYDLLSRLVTVTDALTGTTRYGYDAAGNLLTITDANNHPVTNTYDLLNRLLSATDPLSHTTQYVYDAAGSHLVAMRVVTSTGGNTLYYLLTDHLGSTAMTMDSNGNVLGELRYSAYGATRASSGATPTSHRFTGQYEDSGIGLYFYGARYYSSYLGRWIQPDTIVPEPGNPQNLNRFSYALNNPLKYTDPSGHSVECGFGDPGCRAGKIVQPPPPDEKCKAYGPCYDSYLAYKELVYQLGREPGPSEVLYMTAGTEYWSYVDSTELTPSPPEVSVRAVGREGLARNYYQACHGKANCQGSDLYRFMAGYEPWLGKADRIDGNEAERAMYLRNALNGNFSGTGDELRQDTRMMVGPKAEAEGWTRGKAGDRPWQWRGPVAVTLPSNDQFGLTSDYAILAVNLGEGKYFLMFTANQDARFPK